MFKDVARCFKGLCVVLAVLILVGLVTYSVIGISNAHAASQTSVVHKSIATRPQTANPYRLFKDEGSGTETSLSPSNCQNNPPFECTVQTNGTAHGVPLGSGSYVSTITINWGQASSNGQGGYCAPIATDVQSTAVLNGPNGNSIDITTNSGTICEVGPTGINDAHTFNGTFTITGGTGRFVGATGNGYEIGGDNGKGTSFFDAVGWIVP